MNPEYTTIKFPKIRKATIGVLKAAKRKNMIHSLVEVKALNHTSGIAASPFSWSQSDAILETWKSAGQLCMLFALCPVPHALFPFHGTPLRSGSVPHALCSLLSQLISL